MATFFRMPTMCCTSSCVVLNSDVIVLFPLASLSRKLRAEAPHPSASGAADATLKRPFHQIVHTGNEEDGQDGHDQCRRDAPVEISHGATIPLAGPCLEHPGVAGFHRRPGNLRRVLVPDGGGDAVEDRT